MGFLKKTYTVIKKISRDDVVAGCCFTLALIPSLFLRMFRKDIWLIAERPGVAGDNGLELYKWIRRNHPKDNVYFVLNKDAWNFDAADSNMIAWGSLRHYTFYLASDIHINVMFHSDEINARICRLLIKTIKRNTRIAYIRHGIHKDSVEMHRYSVLGVRLFVCGAKPEYDYFKENGGYPDENLVYTGFARFDDLLLNKRDDHFILIIPTWRRYILDPNVSDLENEQRFIESDYYKRYESLLNNERLNSFLKQTGYTAKFCIHAEFRRYVHLFRTKFDTISIVGSNESVHELLLSTSFLVTDYSSVFFDAAYAEKPMVFYQFDYDEFRGKHFSEGYFSYERDAMGPVIEDEDKLVDTIIRSYDGSKFVSQEEYVKRADRFFPYHDTSNCLRIYNAIKSI